MPGIIFGLGWAAPHATVNFFRLNRKLGLDVGIMII